jgi:hypothetical protein
MPVPRRAFAGPCWDKSACRANDGSRADCPGRRAQPQGIDGYEHSCLSHHLDPRLRLKPPGPGLQWGHSRKGLFSIVYFTYGRGHRYGGRVTGEKMRLMVIDGPR